MKHRSLLSLLFLTSLIAWGCSSQKPIVQMPEEVHIVGHYKYKHSWDYQAPNNQGQMHCDEVGTLHFYPDGTFSDTATQVHTLYRAHEQDTLLMTFDYRCQGQWKVEEHKFIFKELAEGFILAPTKLPMQVNGKWLVGFVRDLVKQSTPNSQRWITFDIDRLDRKAFIWSYGYPDGHRDTWEMERCK